MEKRSAPPFRGGVATFQVGQLWDIDAVLVYGTA